MTDLNNWINSNIKTKQLTVYDMYECRKNESL